jgi:hypothetical protein
VRGRRLSRLTNEPSDKRYITTISIKLQAFF